MTNALDVELRPSVRAHRWLFWLHAVPLVLLPLAMQHGLTLLGVAAGLGLSWAWLRRHPAFGYGPRAVVRLQTRSEGGWRVYRADRSSQDVTLLPDSFRQAGLLIVNFRNDDGRRLSRVLFGDEASDEALRRLRRQLSASTASVPGSPVR